jgi:hypothetical protein
MLLRPMNLLPYLAGPMRELGPYAVVALIVPGGCLIALAFWAFWHCTWLRACVWRTLVAVGFATATTSHQAIPYRVDARSRATMLS